MLQRRRGPNPSPTGHWAVSWLTDSPQFNQSNPLIVTTVIGNVMAYHIHDYTYLGRIRAWLNYPI